MDRPHVALAIASGFGLNKPFSFCIGTDASFEPCDSTSALYTAEGQVGCCRKRLLAAKTS